MLKRFGAVLCTILFICVFACGCADSKDTFSNGRTTIKSDEIQFLLPADTDTVAVINTSAGTFCAVLFPQYAPLAVENFIYLASSGFYDGLEFYRVVNDFIIETGAKNNDGIGGDTKWGSPFGNEFSPYLHHYAGALCMANYDSAPNARSNTSIFYVVAASEKSVSGDTVNLLKQAAIAENIISTYKTAGGLPYLDNTDTVFGQIYSGMDIVDKINAVQTDGSEKPLEPITVTGITITTYGEQLNSNAVANSAA